MFSATWPMSIQGLAAEFMCNPVKVRIGAEGLKASHSVTQVVEVVEPNDKDSHLARVLKKYLGGKKPVPRTLVFALYKKECARLHENLRRQNWQAACIHGDMSQRDRELSVEAFKSGSSPLLIATDVAARGLDIKGVEYVINYTFRSQRRITCTASAGPVARGRRAPRTRSSPCTTRRGLVNWRTC
jgi:ATP-dependent RNA helicase DBP3